MTPFRTALLLVLLSASPALAQPKAGEVQPDRIAVGTVYTGSTVEASFVVYEAGTNPKIKLEVTAPPFVKVLKKSNHAQEFGQGNRFVLGFVEISINTAAAGELRGEVSVTLGQTVAKLPVSATVKARRAGLRRLLIGHTPFAAQTTKDGTMFQAWTDLVKESSLDVAYLLVDRGKPVLRDLDLGQFDCVFLPAEALVFVTPADVKRARAYAEQGGRVVVAANAFYVGSIKQANAVLTGYGLELRDTEARPGGLMDVLLAKDEIDARLVKAGVEWLQFFRASPVAVTDPQKGQILVKALGAGEAGDGFVGIGRTGKGKVLVLGQSLWWNWITKEQAKDTDNAKLLRWLLALPGGE